VYAAPTIVECQHDLHDRKRQRFGVLLEPTTGCSLGSTTSVRLTPSAPGGHCSASAVRSANQNRARRKVLRMIQFKPRWAASLM